MVITAMPKPQSRQTKGAPEELPDITDVLEYEPSKGGATQFLAEVHDVDIDAGTTAPDSALIKAQEALEAQMGGFDAVCASAGKLSDDPTGTLGNIVGFGLGEKVVGGRYTGHLAVKVYVMEKANASDIEDAALVPEAIDGFPTDVEEVGDVSALRFTGRYRPAPGGSSVGHLRITAGTLGCLIVRENNHLCMLSNNHVLANSNGARPGDPIVQPGPIDGGRDPADRIGTLEHFVPIQFGGVIPNLVDAAVAWTNLRVASPRHHCFRINTQPVNPRLGMSVRKCGRTTQGTLGVVTGINVSIRVNYGPAGIALFRNQVQIRGVGSLFSQGGDSGSLVVTAGTLQPTALLFAGGGDLTFANPIGSVIAGVGIRRFLN
jgi:hypothetical protein